MTRQSIDRNHERRLRVRYLTRSFYLLIFICTLLLSITRISSLRKALTRALTRGRIKAHDGATSVRGDSPLEKFHHVGPRASLYVPPSNPEADSLVILCTWLGAGRKHIAKYAAMYQRLAPTARILLIESEVSILVSSYARQRRALQPAIRIVQETSECSPVLLHIFSNGGCNTATQLLLDLREKRGKPLSLIGLIVDSAPALGTYRKEHEAMMLSLPKGFAAQLAGYVAVSTLLRMLHVWIAAGNENPSNLMRRVLLDKTYVCGPKLPQIETPPGSEPDDSSSNRRALETDGDLGLGLRICYLYSKADALVDWRDIVAHAKLAKENVGWRVQEVEFEGTPHCRHYVGNEARYEGAVVSMWDWELGSERDESNGILDKSAHSDMAHIAANTQ